MTWLILTLVAPIFDALNIYTDNYTSDVYFKGRDSAASKYFFILFHGVAGLLFLCFSGFDFSFLSISAILLIILAGIFNSLSTLPYFRALEIDDSTNVGVFLQLFPIFFLLLSWLFLGETLEPLQIVAFVVILLAPSLIVLSSNKRSRGTKLKAAGFVALYALLSVISSLIFIQQTTEGTNYLACIGFLIIGKAIGNAVLCLIFRKWKKRMRYVARRSHGKVYFPMILAGCLNIAYTMMYNAGLMLAPTVAVASAISDSVEPILIFFLGIVLSLIWPRFGREKLDKKTVFIHLGATVIVVIGIVLLQLPTGALG